MRGTGWNKFASYPYLSLLCLLPVMYVPVLTEHDD